MVARGFSEALIVLVVSAVIQTVPEKDTANETRFRNGKFEHLRT